MRENVKNMVNAYPEGANMYNLAKELFPLNRSLTGEGINKSYDIINHWRNKIPQILVAPFNQNNWSVL